MPNPLTATQASQQSGIPKRTILWAIKQGHLRAHKLGDTTTPYIIDRADLDAWLAGREAKTA